MDAPTIIARVTIAQVKAACKRRWGKSYDLRENRDAPDAAGRAIARERARVIREKQKQLTEKIAAFDHDVLRKAARFALDVDADEPSWSRLREATDAADAHAMAKIVRAELEEERKALPIDHYRYSVGHIKTVCGLCYCEIIAQADTLAELLEKIEKRMPLGGAA